MNQIQEEAKREKNARIQSFMDRIRSFGELRFGERHHPWLRHVKIWVDQNTSPHLRYENDKEEGIFYFHFQGPTIRYESLKASIKNACSKEEMEDQLENRFLQLNYLCPDFIHFDSKHDHSSRYRMALYLDYKFYKAMQK